MSSVFQVLVNGRLVGEVSDGGIAGVTWLRSPTALAISRMLSVFPGGRRAIELLGLRETRVLVLIGGGNNASQLRLDEGDVVEVRRAPHAVENSD